MKKSTTTPRMPWPDMEPPNGIIEPPGQFDVTPTDQRIKNEGLLKPFVRYSRKIRPISGVYFGTPLKHRHCQTITLEIPESPAEPPKVSGINYDTEKRPRAVNEFDVDDSELVAFNRKRSKHFDHLRDSLYNSVSILTSLDKATDYVGAALSDGLDIALEMDDRPFEAFVHLARLETLSAVVSKMLIPDRQKRRLLDNLTDALSARAVESMSVADKTEKQRSMIEQIYHARVKPSTRTDVDLDVAEETDSSMRHLGAKRSRR